ncbi:hypothetical protein EELLY_v1c06830 [Entomoplasma ellychniae]|uniref:DivIVA domain-containing protein n=2 Tax=Entomoplasmataceae TaxID=33925 RepID=A0A2S5RGQ1_9MOLU|nr:MULTISPECIES: DivIVA domain-containing protein [Entomoplasmataceae]PPE04997.1 hypothetical protein EELLY_v1c06830 [Entomoplasma ellychniae]PPE06471.1 hypothetical protein MCORR_v1c00990 [Mesoplasma corruscae]
MANKITPQEITKKIFGTELSGYKIESVNNFLDKVSIDLEYYINQINDLEKSINKLNDLNKKYADDISMYQKAINKLHEENKQITKEKLSDFNVIKSIEEIRETLREIKEKI